MKKYLFALLLLSACSDGQFKPFDCIMGSTRIGCTPNANGQYTYRDRYDPDADMKLQPPQDKQK